MWTKLICLILVVFVQTCIGSAQVTFAEAQDRIFALSEKQWICSELKSIHPKHFDCSNQEYTWQFPESDSLVFGNVTVFLTAFDREIFRELLFPDGQCERYITLVSLCDLYFPLLKKKAEEKGLSADYKYVPLLLSGLNQSYISKDRSGIWAMDYLTARKVHLRVDSLIDERNGGDFTTSAVYQYFHELETKFEGDMLKGIAGYRMGMPAASKIQASETGEFLALLPEYERKSIQFLAYVKSLIESTRIQNQLQHYFDIFGQYEGVVIEQNSRLDAMQAVLNLDISHIRKVNPVFVGSIIPALYRKIPYLLPLEKAALWKIQKDSIARWQPPLPFIPVDTTQSIVYHTVKKGESLGSIAKKHRTTIRKIKTLNKLKSDKIKPGQRLIVSKTTSQNAPTMEAESSDKQPDEQIVPSNTSKQKTKNNTVTYRVKNGDSLWKIANKYKGVSPDDIKKWNKCGDDLRPGQKLIIHLSK